VLGKPEPIFPQSQTRVIHANPLDQFKADK